MQSYGVSSVQRRVINVNKVAYGLMCCTSGAHYEIKFRGLDDVVFDISPLPWPGGEDAGEKEAAE